MRRTCAFTASLAACQRAVAMAPGNALFQRTLAHALSLVGQYEEAIALRRSFDFPTAEDTAALIDDFRSAGQHETALEIANAAETRGALSARARFARGLTLLQMGEYRQGFSDFEAHFEAGLATMPDTKGLPKWDGEIRPDERLLVFADQGLGDTLMKARFLPDLAGSGVRATLVAPRALLRLLRESLGGVEVVDMVGDVRRYAAWAATGSLPFYSRLNGDPPPPLPLSIPRQALERGAKLTRPHADQFRIGLCWSGDPRHPRNHRRSIPVAKLLPLLSIPGVRAFSLYKGPAIKELRIAGAEGLVSDVSNDDVDLADTAGLIAALHLVITTDTAVAHVAGSLGQPVWLLLPFEGFWQYGRAGETTPWYPSMRIYRQHRIGDWTQLMARAVRDLEARVEACHASSSKT